jgi:hypothetical protein
MTLGFDQRLAYGVRLKVSQRIWPFLISTTENRMLIKTGA